MSARRRWGLLVTVGLGLVMITLDHSILFTALPTLTAQLDASSAQSLWIINAYPLVVAGLLLGSGTLGDRIGHRRMFVSGLVIFGVASLAAAFAPSAMALIAARAALGVGAAAMMPATLALIRITFDVERERNIAIGVWGSLAVVGAALGPIAGGVLLEYFWWGSVFLINVPVVIAALVAITVIAPANPVDPCKAWDAVSSAQVMVALMGAVLTIKELAHSPQNWPVIAVSLSAAVVGFVLFVRRQRRLATPLLDFALFRHPAFASGVIAAVAAMFAISGVELLTTQRYQLVAGFTPLQAGVLVTMVALGSLPTALLGGAFVHRTGLRPMIAGGLGAATLGIVTVIGAVRADALPFVVVGLLAAGAGLGAAMSVASIAIVGNAPVHRAGMASSVEEVSYEFGSLTAVALLGSALTFVSSASFASAGSPDVAEKGVSGLLTSGDASAATLESARAAFDGGYLTAMIGASIIVAAGTVVTARLLRSRPGTDGSDPARIARAREYASVGEVNGGA